MANNTKGSEASGFGVPSVLVSNVFLESGGGAPNAIGHKSGIAYDGNSEDPHIDYTFQSFPNVNNIVDKQSSKDNPNKLIVTLNLVFKDVITVGENSWFEEEELLKSYKMIFVQSTNPVSTAALLDSDIYTEAPKILDNWSYMQGVIIEEKSLLDVIEGTYQDLAKKIVTASTSDDGVYSKELRASIKYTVPHADPKHLSYFIIPFIDIGEITEDSPIAGEMAFYNAVKTNPNLIGKPTSEIIIENYSVSSGAIIFYDSDNNPYNGPVHWTPPESPTTVGFWSKGESNTDLNFYHEGSTINTSLKPVKTGNIKIHDFRIIQKLDKLSLNFTGIQNEALLNFSPIQDADPWGWIKFPYFTDMKLSRDSLGRARYFFGMNFSRLVRDSSPFKGLHDFAEPDMRTKFIFNSSIRSMKVKRRRIEESYCENQLLDSCSDYIDFEDPNEIDEIIAESFDIKTGSSSKNYFKSVSNFSKKIAKFGKGRSPKSKKMGSLREVELNLSANIRYGGIRHFTGIDEDIISVTDGEYQYGVELEITDGVPIVLQGLVNTANANLRNLEEYLNEAIGHPQAGSGRNSYVDTTTNMFTNAFKNQEKKKTDQYEVAVADSVASVIEIMQLTTKKPNVTEVGKALIQMSHYKTGSAAGIEALIKILRTLRDKLSKMLASTTTTKRHRFAGSFTHKSEISDNKNSTSFRPIKKENWFRNVFDADVDKGVGYEFLSTSARGFNFEAGALSKYGLLTMTDGQMQQRVEAELRKMFSDVAVSTAETTVFNTQYTSNDSLATTAHRFLAPSHISLPNMENPFNQIIYDKSLFDLMGYAKLFADIYTYNKKGNIPKDSEITTNPDLISLTEQEQVLKKRLSNALFTRNCTVEKSMSLSEALLLQGVTDSLPSNITKDVSESPVVGHLFGKSDHLPATSGKIQESPIDLIPNSYEPKADTYKDLLNPSALLMSLININNFNTHDSRSSMLWYDITNSTENFILEAAKELGVAYNNAGGTGTISKLVGDKLANAPNHIKFLVAQSSRINLPTLRYDWAPGNVTSTYDVLKDQKWYPAIWMNFKNLMEVEVLTTYGTVSTGMLKMIAPYAPLNNEVWLPLKPELIKENGTYLCRLVRYNSPILNINHPKAMELPIYHEHFMIKVGSLAGGAAVTTQINLDHARTLSKNILKAVIKVADSSRGPENSHSAIVGKTDTSNKAKKFLYQKLGEIASTATPMDVIKEKAPVSKMKSIVGKSVTFFQQNLDDTETTTSGGGGGGSGGTY